MVATKTHNKQLFGTSSVFRPKNHFPSYLHGYKNYMKWNVHNYMDAKKTLFPSNIFLPK